MTASRSIILLSVTAALAALTFASDAADAQGRRGFAPSFSQRPIIAPKIAAPRVVIPRTPPGRLVTRGDTPLRVVGRPGKSHDGAGTIGQPPKRNPDGKPKPPKGETGRPDEPKRPPTIIVRPPVVKPPIRVVCNGGRVSRGTCICPPGSKRLASDAGTTCAPVVVVTPPDRRPPIRIPPIVSVFPVLPPVIEQWPPRAPTFTSPPPSPPRLTRPASPPPVPFVPTPALADATIVPDEVILSVQATASTDVEDGIAQRFNLTLIERTTSDLLGQRVIRYRIPDGRLVPAVVAALGQDAAAIGPQPNYLYRPQQATSESTSSLQYALAKVELAAAHGFATGRGAVVGIIDSGVDTAHDDLKNSDIVTFDAAGGDSLADGHGTAIAGIIGGRGTTRGIAPAARLLSARAFAPRKSGVPQLTTSYVLLKALDWTVTEKARVVNLSLAGPEDPVVKAAIRSAIDRSVIIVAAAGNNGRAAPAAYPAAYDGVIATTAIDADDRLYDKANIGTYVAVAAPGVDVIAPSSSGTHEMHTGTSFAAAHVTGIVALMLERKPDSTPKEVRAVLLKSAFDLGRIGPDDEFGAGRVNAAEALKLVATSSAN